MSVSRFGMANHPLMMQAHAPACTVTACAAGCPAAPTHIPAYAGMSDVDRTARARASLEIARWLDTASLAETIALGRCAERIDVLRKPQPAAECTPDRCSPACPLDQWSALDQALQLELTDVRLEREHGHEADRDAIVGATSCRCVQSPCPCACHRGPRCKPDHVSDDDLGKIEAASVAASVAVPREDAPGCRWITETRSGPGKGTRCGAEIVETLHGVPSCAVHSEIGRSANRMPSLRVESTIRATLAKQAPAMAALAAMERQERPGEVAGKYVTLGWYDGPILEIARVQTSDPEVGDLLDVRSSGVGVIIDSGGYPSATLRLSRSDLQAMLAHLDGGIDHVPSEQHAAQAELA